MLNNLNIDRDRHEEMLSEVEPAPCSYIVLVYDVKGRQQACHVFEDDSYENALDKYTEEIEGLEDDRELDCKVQLWSAKSYLDYQDMPGDQPPMQVSRLQEDELLEEKVI